MHVNDCPPQSAATYRGLAGLVHDAGGRGMARDPSGSAAHDALVDNE